MMHVLIISENEKTANEIKVCLHTEAISMITLCKHSIKARRLVLEHMYDIIIINYPFMDETDYSLPLDFAEKCDASILLMCTPHHYDTIVERMENVGVYVLAKPVQRQVLMQMLHFMIITQKRMQQMKNKAMNLSQKLQDIKQIDRAKCLLIEKEHLTELQAHKYIEKQAMDSQMSRIYVAKKLIKKYDTIERR